MINRRAGYAQERAQTDLHQQDGAAGGCKGNLCHGRTRTDWADFGWKGVGQRVRTISHARLRSSRQARHEQTLFLLKNPLRLSDFACRNKIHPVSSNLLIKSFRYMAMYITSVSAIAEFPEALLTKCEFYGQSPLEILQIGLAHNWGKLKFRLFTTEYTEFTEV